MTNYTRDFPSQERTKKEKFRLFWINRSLPEELLNQVMSKIKLVVPIEIDVFNSISAWNNLRKMEPKVCIRIGEKLKKAGEFDKTKPTGYFVRPNRLVIFVPNLKLKNGRIHYTFR